MLGRGKLQYHEVPSRLQHPVHFGDALLDTLKVAYAKCGGYGVELIVGLGQGGAVLLLEGDVRRESGLLNLLSSYFHHALR